MALKSTRLYLNTGFSPGNVPDSPALLNSCQYIDLNYHYDKQEQFLSSMLVQARYEQVQNADYLKYGNTYYFIIGIRAINENNIQLFLEPDALTTMGGPNNLNYVGGVVSQAHTRTDDYLLNTIDPNIGCSQILTLKSKPVSINFKGKVIVASTLDLSADVPEPDANGIIDNNSLIFNTEIGVGESSKLYTVVVPDTLPAAKPTTVGGGSHAYQTAGFGYYDYDNTNVKKAIKYLRTLGTEGAILYSYQVPPQVVQGTTAKGHITTLATPQYTGIHTTLTEDYGSYRNKKTYTTYSKYTLQSVLSGDSQTYDVGDIISNSSIDFKIFMDPQYGGRAYCYPTVYRGHTAEELNIVRGVKSLPWKDFPIVFNTMSGQQWAKNEYAFARGDIDRGIFNNAVGSGFNAGQNAKTSDINMFGQRQGLGLGSLGSTLMNGAKNIGINAIGAINDLSSDYAKGNLDDRTYGYAKIGTEYSQKQVIAPDLTCSPALGLQNIWTYQFVLYHLLPTTTDLERIDRFYTMYGYPQGNTTFKKEMLSGRQYFNYIQASGIEIVRNGGAANVGIAMRRQAEYQINAGVRIWHTLPQPVESNPIV